MGGPLVTLTYVRQAGEPAPTRMGVVAGKRVGGAVVRNRVKRRMREALRRELPHIPAGWDLVCGAKPPAAEAPYAALAAELRALLVRAGLLSGHDGPPAAVERDAGSPPVFQAPEPSQNRSEQP